MKKILCLLIVALSAEGQFTSAISPSLLSKSWPASWISHPAASRSGHEVLHFRKTFDVLKKPEKFIIHISADNRYWLYINGKRICTGPAKGDVAHWRFESLDVAPYLKPGKNVLAALVWNSGEYAAWSQISYQTGLVIQGNTETESIINTNASWKTLQDHAYTPLFEDFKVVGARELYFEEKYPVNWEAANYKDTTWSNAIVVDDAVPVGAKGISERKLVQRNIPLPDETPQRFGEIRKAEGIKKEDAFIRGTGDLQIYPWQVVTLLLDQKYLTTAYPELMYSGGKGAKITITYLEAPFIDFSKEYKGNRNEIEGKTIKGIYDIVLPSGKQHMVYRPLYYRTFRYVELKIENYLQPLTIHNFSSVFTGYPFKENSSFDSDDASLKDIWNISWRTARLCAYETYMDCPYYEQLQYVGDTRIQALISLYVSGDERLMKNAINQYNDSRIPEGLTRSRYPDHLQQIIPPFSLFWTIMVYDFWKHKSDDAFVKSHLKGIGDVLRWYENKIDPATGMMGTMPHWNFVDWPREWPWKGQDRGSGMPAGSDDGGSSIHTLQFAYALDMASEVFAAYGMQTEATSYKKLADLLKAATYKACWDPAKGMMANLPNKKEFSQHANTMAVLTEAVKGAEAKKLMENTITDTSIVQCTVYFRFYLSQALKKVGLGDQYIPMLSHWRDMLKIGLTTCAEKPEPSRSDCHAWSASPNYDLLATVIGIESGSPGFKSVKIAPNMGPLQSAEGKLIHPNGAVVVKLKRKGKAGIEATIALPVNTNGIFVWNNKEVKLKPGEQTIKL